MHSEKARRRHEHDRRTGLKNLFSDCNGGSVELELLTVPDVARALRVSERQVYLLMESGRLPSVRLGRLRRVAPAALEKFITALPRAGAPRPPRSHGQSLGATGAEAG